MLSIESIIKKKREKIRGGKEELDYRPSLQPPFVIKSSEFDNQNIGVGENHFRDFTLCLKERFGVELTDLQREDQTKIVDLLKDNIDGLLVGIINLDSKYLDPKYNFNAKSQPTNSVDNVVVDSVVKLILQPHLKPQDNNISSVYERIKDLINNNKEKLGVNVEFYDDKQRVIIKYDKKCSVELIIDDSLRDKLEVLRWLDANNIEKEVGKIAFSVFYEYSMIPTKPDEFKNQWPPRKVFHSNDFLRNQSYYLGEKISNIIKEKKARNVLLYGVFRGGVRILQGISEYLRKDPKLNNVSINNGVIVASSYINQKKVKETKIKGIIPEEIKGYDLIVVIDELIDTGGTFTNIRRLLNEERKFPEDNVLFVVIDYKNRTYKEEEFKKNKPDQYIISIDINSHKEEVWIVYDIELEGLTPREEKECYGKIYTTPKNINEKVKKYVPIIKKELGMI